MILLLNIITTEPPAPAYNHDMAYLIGGGSWVLFYIIILWPIWLIFIALLRLLIIKLFGGKNGKCGD